MTTNLSALELQHGRGGADADFLEELDVTPCPHHEMTPRRLAALAVRRESVMAYFEQTSNQSPAPQPVADLNLQ